MAKAESEAVRYGIAPWNLPAFVQRRARDKGWVTSNGIWDDFDKRAFLPADFLDALAKRTADPGISVEKS